MTSTTSQSRCFITLSLGTWTVRFARAALSMRLKIFLPPAEQDKSGETDALAGVPGDEPQSWPPAS